MSDVDLALRVHFSRFLFAPLDHSILSASARVPLIASFRGTDVNSFASIAGGSTLRKQGSRVRMSPPCLGNWWGMAGLAPLIQERTSRRGMGLIQKQGCCVGKLCLRSFSSCPEVRADNEPTCIPAKQRAGNDGIVFLTCFDRR